MTSPKTSAKSSPALPMNSGFFATLTSMLAPVRRAVAGGRLKRWTLRLIAAVVVLYALWRLFLVAVRIITSQMWFDSVGQGEVYRTMTEARVLLFVVFGALAGLLGGLVMVALRRITPTLPVSADDDTFRWTFRRYESRIGKVLVVAAVLVPAILVGSRAAAGWQTYLLWLHSTPFGTTDPLFGKDISFFVEENPFYLLVLSLLTQAVTYGLYIAFAGGYWYAAWRLRGGNRKITRGFTVLLSLLFAGYVVLKAVNYWLARYALTTSGGGGVTGASYTDTTAGLPSKYVLAVVALLCAAGLVANALVIGRVRTLVAALVVLAVASGVVGSAVPALVLHYREAPSAATLDLPEIAHNQKATLAAFGLDSGVTTVPYSPSSSGGTATSTDALVALAQKTAQASVIDQNQLSPTFNVEQQLQAYYGFKSTLDVSHYPLGGRTQDVALAVRELRSAGIPHKSWANQHLVYTHGYGVVAAPTTEVDPATANPVFLGGGDPTGQQIPVTRPEIYFGQGLSSSYAIVGQPAGSRTNLEFDHPGVTGKSASAYTTYQGRGGIPIGSALRRLLFAVQLGDPNIFFSSELNSASQLLMTRDPATRVATVAPWLTLDGDTYPAIVDGRVQWIVDGYTTSANYPNSQLVNFHSASRTTLTANGASVAQSGGQVNYLQNSVKAVVDAYTGKVTLYEWNQQQHRDPLLKAWESVFPGLVRSQSDIPSSLVPQLRYPTDLFNVQRSLLAKYHVTKPSSFYSGNDFWTVPTDPTVAAANTINSTGSGSSSVPMPSHYMSMSPDGTGTQQYLLSSPLVTLNGRQLASFVSVGAEPGPDYGKFTVLDFPTDTGSEAPSQVQNDIESDTAITEALTLQRGGNSSVVLGALQAIPVAGRILYVEPVYTQSSGSSSFPILRHVIALYGNGSPSFEDTLAGAIKAAVRSGVGGTTG